MSPDKLVYMANQIATFFKSQPDADKAARVAAHIKDFWEPRMREQFFALMDAGQLGIDPLVVDAMTRLRQPA
ncbi:MAG: formate dehydrogenase [Limimaricola sp.]|uniref:formate dehydrogenase subunit delta n=1 Tax=Limimaricola sp. TaxID=2211665 RepID=UPI001D9E394A|nr:formate dehydrogenase subunit delta [Limimaricola sp.]MBI1417571.1 formate dehydrogenase [Limimaricola sp.]